MSDAEDRVPKKRTSRRLKVRDLIIESDIPHFTSIARWEHELLAPIANKALQQIMDEMEAVAQQEPPKLDATKDAEATQVAQPVLNLPTPSSPPPKVKRSKSPPASVREAKSARLLEARPAPVEAPVAKSQPPIAPTVETTAATDSNPLAADLVLLDESEAELEEVHRAIVDALQPVGTIERMLVEQVVAHEWWLRRLRRAGMAALKELQRLRRELDSRQERRRGK